MPADHRPSRDEKDAAVAAAMAHRGAETLREEAAERMKEQLLQEMRRQEQAACGESCAQDSMPWRLLRNKRFWYLVFGTLFLLYMAGLVVWVCHDLAK